VYPSHLSLLPFPPTSLSRGEANKSRLGSRRDSDNSPLKAPRSKAGSCLLCPGSSQTGPAGQGRAAACGLLGHACRVGRAWVRECPGVCKVCHSWTREARRLGGPSPTGRRFNSQLEPSPISSSCCLSCSAGRRQRMLEIPRISSIP
jgi:hypothetical protein